MKICIYLLFPLFILQACSNAKSAEPEQSVDSKIQSPKDKDKENNNPNLKKVIYLDAAVYAAATSYYFTDEEGKDFEVKVSTIPGEETLKMPEGLLETGETEGPPGPNPSMIGKPFEIRYNGRGKIISVKNLSGNTMLKSSIELGLFSKIPEDYGACAYAKSKNGQAIFVENQNGDAQMILAGKTINLIFDPKIEGYSGDGYTILKELETTHSEHEYIEEAGELIIKSNDKIVARVKVIGSCGV